MEFLLFKYFVLSISVESLNNVYGFFLLSSISSTFLLFTCTFFFLFLEDLIASIDF